MLGLLSWLIDSPEVGTIYSMFVWLLLGAFVVLVANGIRRIKIVVRCDCHENKHEG